MPRRRTYADHLRDPRAAEEEEEEEEDYYEVFLSFRGKDTRAGLTDPLYRSLVEKEVCVYRENKELHTGKVFGPELLSVITRSGILIPILSENYGSREWCLRELTQMMERKRNIDGYVVLPVFYGVKPADVRHQVGTFGERFRSGTRQFNERVVEDWKQALREVCSIVGFEPQRGKETELIKRVVERVCGLLKEAHHLTWSRETTLRARLEKDYRSELTRLAKANRGAEERENLAHHFHDSQRQRENLAHDFHYCLRRTPVPRSMRSDGKMVRNKILITLHQYPPP